jgi:hypothetical protein
MLVAVERGHEHNSVLPRRDGKDHVLAIDTQTNTAWGSIFNANDAQAHWHLLVGRVVFG